MESCIQEELIIRLQDERDIPEVEQLRRLCLPRAQRQLSKGKRGSSLYEATLVAHLPTGELAASTRLGIARTPQALSEQLGMRMDVGSKDLPVLTTSFTCCLVGRHYLAALRAAYLCIAQRLVINSWPLASHMSVLSTSQPMRVTELKQLGYDTRDVDTATLKGTVKLHRRSFGAASRKLTLDMFERKMPWFSYVGPEPFEQWLKDY